MSDVSTNDSQKLRKCPFCGGEAEIKQYRYEKIDLTLWSVRCKTRPYDVDESEKCYAANSFVSFDTEAEAIEAWNRRANDADGKAPLPS